MAYLTFNPNSIDSYRQFLAVKRLPIWRIRGREAWIPDEYAASLGIEVNRSANSSWQPSDFLFDYQRDITQIALDKRKYCVFADCGLGKTLIILEFVQGALNAMRRWNKGCLIVSPLMVVSQTIDEAAKFYPGLEIESVSAADLPDWLARCGGKIGITNYEAIKGDLGNRHLGCLVLDESSMLKSHYGKWGTRLLELGRGIPYKLCCTGTPAPNDRIEYANHAVFMDAFPTVNAFLATYFVNRGQTQDRWALKDHALGPFYKSLSHWSIFLTNPSTYGWQDNTANIPPIHVNIHDVPLTEEQRRLLGVETGQLFANELGGITNRSTMAQLAKGKYKGKSIPSNKPRYIVELVESWPDESTMIWCHYNDEQEALSKMFPCAANISGSTPHDERMELIRDFKRGDIPVMITKPKILGFGLNLQIATRQVFSGLQDSYEQYYQAVKRSNRIGSTKPLNVHIPVTDIETPMVDNVLRKADRVMADTLEQERIFKQHSWGI